MKDLKIHINGIKSKAAQNVLSIFSLICALLLIWAQIKTGKTSFTHIVFTLCFLISIPLSLYQLYFDKSDGLREIILSMGSLFFVGYNNKQKEIKEIKLDNIESCKFIFSKYFDLNKLTRDYEPYFFEICIKTKDNQSFSTKLEMGSSRFLNVLKETFCMAKFIPNFSYNVDTNQDGLRDTIEHYAEPNKKRKSLTESLRTFFYNPNVNSNKKVLVAVLLIYGSFQALFLFILIAKFIIIDIMGG